MVRSANAGYIPHNFNTLWCDAYNQREQLGIDRFAMHHADIVTEPGFLDILSDELDKSQCDIISVAIPIGDERGLTSTGIHTPGTWNVRRLSLTEIHGLPETFWIMDTPWPGANLVVNTGLFMCRFDKPWVDDFPGFNLPTRVVDVGGKKYTAQFPEDWGMSKWMNDRGLRVLCTRKVKAEHIKPKAYGNDLPWGTWVEDHDALELPEEVKHGNCLASTGHSVCD